MEKRKKEKKPLPLAAEVVVSERDGESEEKILGEIGFDFLVYHIRTCGIEKIWGNF
jgi:hypothetical protein